MLSLESLVNSSSGKWWPKLESLEKRFTIIPVGKVNRIKYLKNLKIEMLKFEKELLNILQPHLETNGYRFQFNTETKEPEACDNNDAQNPNCNILQPVNISTNRFQFINANFTLSRYCCPVCLIPGTISTEKICTTCGTPFDLNFLASRLEIEENDSLNKIKVMDLYNFFQGKMFIPELEARDVLYIRNDDVALGIYKNKQKFILTNKRSNMVLLRNVDALKLIKGLNKKLF